MLQQNDPAAPPAPAAPESPSPSGLPARTRWAIAGVGGVAMGLAPDPTGWWWLAWVALAPLWVAICEPLPQRRDLPGGMLRDRLGPAAVWGLAYHGLALRWIAGIHPMDWMGVPWLQSLAIAGFCWGFVALWGAALAVVWAAGLGWVSARLAARREAARVPQERLAIAAVRVLVGTALWCLLEAAWQQLPLWWSALSLTQSPYNLAILQLGRASGPATVAAALVAVNGWLAEAVLLAGQGSRRSPRRGRSLLLPARRGAIAALAIALGLAAGLHGLGAIALGQPLADDPASALVAGAVQGNIPNRLKFGSEGWRRALAGYTTGYESLADGGADLVVLPETALPTRWDSPQKRRSDFYRALRDRGVPAVVGAFGSAPESPAPGDAAAANRRARPRRYTNSLFATGERGQTVGRYDKTQLVPLGEFVPLERWLGRWIDRLSPLDSHLVPGDRDQVLATPYGPAIAGICYDSAFAEVFRRQAAAGGAFAVTAANNAHYSLGMLAQHHAQDVLRAVETDRWLVRATNTGYSAIVDPHGVTRWRSRANAYDLHAEPIYRRQTRTPYVRWGDWLTPLLAIAAILLWRCFANGRLR